MADAGDASTAGGSLDPGAGERDHQPHGKKAEVDGRRVLGESSSSSGRDSDRNDRGKEAAASPRSASPDAGGSGGSGVHRGFFPPPGMENWPFGPPIGGPEFGFGGPHLVPVLLPAPFPPYFPMPGSDQQQHAPPGGVFAVPMMQVLGPGAGIPPHGGFVPMSFSMPPVPPPPVPADGCAAPADRPAVARRAAPQPELRDAAPAEGLRQRRVGGEAAIPPQRDPRPPAQPQRPHQVVRRFHVGFQLDLLLILKLAVVVIVFNQDGTKDKLFLLLLLASLVYLYQTGALAPILQWISINAQRAMMLPQQRPAGVREAPNPDRLGPPNARDAQGGQEVRQAPLQGAGPRADETEGADEPRAEQPAQNPNWWGIIKELQMIVVGFLTSLLPGFQQVE